MQTKPRLFSSQSKTQLQKDSPEFKRKNQADDNPLINKPIGLTKVRSTAKLSSSAREFKLTGRKTNENTSNNKSFISIDEKLASLKEVVKLQEEEDENSAAKIKLNKQSRPFTKFRPEGMSQLAAESKPAKSNLSTKSRLFYVKNSKP